MRRSFTVTVYRLPRQYFEYRVDKSGRGAYTGSEFNIVSLQTNEAEVKAVRALTESPGR